MNQSAQTGRQQYDSECTRVPFTFIQLTTCLWLATSEKGGAKQRQTEHDREVMLKSTNLLQWRHLNASFEFFPLFPSAGLPPGRHLGHYPSLPPGYQNTSAPHGATSPMHPAMQAATQPYTQAPQPYQQVSGGTRVADWTVDYWLPCLWRIALRSSLSNLHPHLLATCWSGSGPAEPVPGCHEPPVQHPGGPESGQPVAGEEPAATDRHPCPDAMSPTGPAEGQLQPRVSHSRLLRRILADDSG